MQEDEKKCILSQVQITSFPEHGIQRRKTRNCRLAENENLFRGVDGWRGRAKTSFYHWWNGTRTLPIKR